MGDRTPSFFNWIIMIKTKSLFVLLSCLILVCGTISCVNKQDSKSTDTSKSYAGTLTAADTTAVLNLANQCMELLKGNYIEEALQMMHSTVDGKPISLSETQKQKLNSKFRMFPILKYTLEGYNFTSETNNIVRYKSVFFVCKEENGQTPNTIGVVFVPIRIGGKWYLTIPETN